LQDTGSNTKSWRARNREVVGVGENPKTKHQLTGFIYFIWCYHVLSASGKRFLRIKHGLSTSWCPHFLKRNWANPMMKCGRFWRGRNHLNSSKLMAEAGDDMADIVFFQGTKAS